MKVIWSIELVLLALLALIQPLQAKDWPKEPLADVQQAAERGDADAQFSLGFRYDNGLGVPQDAAQAVVWYRKAAEQGNAGAQFALGAMYATGQGTPQDYQQAYAWSSVAAANGNADAVKNRDIVAKRLTQAQLEKAQALATRYFEQSRPKYGLTMSVTAHKGALR